MHTDWSEFKAGEIISQAFISQKILMFLGIACNTTVDWQGLVKTSEFLITVKQACANFVELGAKKITVSLERVGVMSTC